MLKRIKYISRTSQPLSEEQVQRIRDVSVTNNVREHITGILIEVQGIFFQVMEGPAEAVDHLYERISRDERHTEMLLLSSMDNLPSRMFPDWAMKTVQLGETDGRTDAIKLLLETTVEAHARVEHLTSGIERVVWQTEGVERLIWNQIAPSDGNSQ
jgi:hypothetical protein